ncbi:MAG: iron uptake porin [Cyanobacteriota bacterium]|nr:iron uptake porin [Cyanobacteriota bacterium]
MASNTHPLLRPAALVLLAPFATVAGAGAGELNPSGSARFANSAQVTSLAQFGDVRPTDWAHQALTNLNERYGCVAGHTSGTYSGQRTMSRFEAAALLNACLDRATEKTDALKALVAEFEAERAILYGRVDGLEKNVGLLEAQQFSTTTKLSGHATMVLGGTAFGGNAINGRANTVNTVSQGALPLTNAFTFNFDVKLILDTSLAGQDLLRTVLRGGNFDGTNNSFGGGGPTTLATLETAFQEASGPNAVGIYKLYYQAPIGGGLTLTLGPRVAQEDLLAYWPSVYPASPVLDVFTIGGAPVAINYNRGAGAGLWWQDQGWSLSAGYVAANGSDGSPATGGLGTANAGSSGSVQLAYQQQQWGLSVLYSAVQGGVTPYGTLNLLANGLNGASTNLTQALALNGNWQPANPGWIPSISAGVGLNRTVFNQPQPASTPTASRSWSVGLQWLDALAAGNTAGMAFGQAPYATSLSGGQTANDSNWMWEWWYAFQLSDNISITPALFYLSRPLGQETPAGQNFNQLGALLKTQFRF